MEMSQRSDAAIVKIFEQSQDALVLQASDLSLETIAQMVDGEAIDLDPHYQRRERWKPSAQCELIESFLLNVPVPPVYLAEDDFGTYSVIDGKQRITAIHRFMRNGFHLDGLTRFTEVNKLYFKDLPKALKNALSIRPYIRVVTLLKQSNPELKYEVFTRLNTGGQPLLPQEIRNALFRGPFNDLLFKLSKNSAFLRRQLKIATEKESAYTEMTDVEMVLRFLALSENWGNFSGDYRRQMDEFMGSHRKISDDNIKTIENRFNSTISRCEKLWGENAFRRFSQGLFRDQFLAAMFDAQMIAAENLSPAEFDLILTRKVAVIKNTKALFEDKRFEEAIRVSTNTPSRVRYRVEMVFEMLKKTLVA